MVAPPFRLLYMVMKKLNIDKNISMKVPMGVSLRISVHCSLIACRLFWLVIPFRCSSRSFREKVETSFNCGM